MMTFTLRKIGNEIILYDGNNKITAFAGKTVDEVKNWIATNIKNVRVVC